MTPTPTPPQAPPLGPTDCPFTIIVDSREQSPYLFREIRTDARQGGAVLAIPMVRAVLKSGDYSIEGFESRVAVERKSPHDLYNTLGQGRRRFERELRRLSEYDFAAVVVEAGWGELIRAPPEHSRLNPKTVFRSVVAWQQRYPRVHWWACPNRRFAEVATFRILERFWRDHVPCVRT